LGCKKPTVTEKIRENGEGGHRIRDGGGPKTNTSPQIRTETELKNYRPYRNKREDLGKVINRTGTQGWKKSRDVDKGGRKDASPSNL